MSKLKLSTRYGLVGVGGLAAVSLVHWARGLPYGSSLLYQYLLGVLPSLLAALAIPFVFLGIWADQNLSADYAAAQRWFTGFAAGSGAVLIAWELIQQTSRGLVFDVHDIGATILGLLLAFLLFVWVTPRPRHN